MSSKDYGIPGLINETYVKARKIDEVYDLHKNNRMSTPKYQRHPTVWKEKQKQEWLLTICERGNAPQFFVQNYVDRHGGLEKFRLLEGQQRVETIADFMDNKIKLDDKIFGGSDAALWGNTKSGKKASSLAGKKWKEFELEEQEKFKEYPLIFFELKGDEDEMRDLYLRLGSKGTKQNNPEIRHAKFYKSEFGKVTEAFAEQNRQFYLDNGIVVQGHIDRMVDFEITAELFVLVLNGPEGSAKKLDQYYDKYSTFGEKGKAISQVSGALTMIKKIFQNQLKGSDYDNLAGLYALVGALAPIDVRYNFPSDSWGKMETDLRKFIKDVNNGGERATNGSSIRNYWESVQDATRSKAHRKMRIDAVAKQIWKYAVIKDNQRLFTEPQKRLIWNRDSKHKCEICKGKVRIYEEYEPDHKIPDAAGIAKGGTTTIANGQISHKWCNRAEGAKGIK